MTPDGIVVARLPCPLCGDFDNETAHTTVTSETNAAAPHAPKPTASTPANSENTTTHTPTVWRT